MLLGLSLLLEYTSVILFECGVTRPESSIGIPVLY